MMMKLLKCPPSQEGIDIKHNLISFDCFTDHFTGQLFESKHINLQWYLCFIMNSPHPVGSTQLIKKYSKQKLSSRKMEICTRSLLLHQGNFFTRLC